MSASLQYQGLQYIRPPCPSPTPGVYSNSCPLSYLCHPIISSSVVPFSSCFNLSQHQGLPKESVLCIRCPKHWSLSFSISPYNEYTRLISLGGTGLTPLLSKGLLRVFSNTTVQKHQFFGAQLPLYPTLTPTHDYWKNCSFDWMDLCWQSNVSTF